MLNANQTKTEKALINFNSNMQYINKFSAPIENFSFQITLKPLEIKNPYIQQAYKILANGNNNGFTLSDVRKLAVNISNNHYNLGRYFNRYHRTMVSTFKN